MYTLAMQTIDADTHVDETEDTSDYLLPSEQHLKPAHWLSAQPRP